MAIIEIEGLELNVDIREELEAFEWGQPKWSNEKLIATSPFREERTPSFFVRLEPYGEFSAGVWSDSGAYDIEYKSGSFVRLLAFLRNETESEAADYLIEKYGATGEGKLRLIMPRLSLRKPLVTMDKSIIEVLPSPYLLSRGITAEVQQQAGIGRSKHKGFVAIPWKTYDGRIANVKYRATTGKNFFYEKDATPIRQLVYGIETVTKREPVILCEAEIDALTWRVAGFQSVALGGVVFTDWQADILRRSPATCFVICGDNDRAGQLFNERVAKKLNAPNLKVIEYMSKKYKDANEICNMYGIALLQNMFENARYLHKFGL